MNEQEMNGFDKELEERIGTMESGEYEFPARMTGRDYAAAAAAVAVCLAMIIAGAFL